MDGFIIAGICVSAIGLAGLVYCIVVAMKIRRSGGTQADHQAKFQRLVALNMGSLMLSMTGLMLVIVGIFL